MGEVPAKRRAAARDGDEENSKRIMSLLWEQLVHRINELENVHFPSSHLPAVQRTVAAALAEFDSFAEHIMHNSGPSQGLPHVPFEVEVVRAILGVAARIDESYLTFNQRLLVIHSVLTIRKKRKPIVDAAHPSARATIPNHSQKVLGMFGEENQLALEESQSDIPQWRCAVEEDQLALHETNGGDECKQMVAAERRRRAAESTYLVLAAQLRQATEVAMTAAAAAASGDLRGDACASEDGTGIW